MKSPSHVSLSPIGLGLLSLFPKKLKCPLQDQRAAIPVVALECKAMYSEGLALFTRYPRSSSATLLFCNNTSGRTTVPIYSDKLFDNLHH